MPRHELSATRRLYNWDEKESKRSEAVMYSPSHPPLSSSHPTPSQPLHCPPMNAPTQQRRQQQQLLRQLACSLAADAASSLAEFWHHTRKDAETGIRKRFDRLKDRLFYETLLLLQQPSLVLLVLLWPGWVLVFGVCLWACG